MRFFAGLCAIALAASAGGCNAASPASDADDANAPDRKAWAAYEQGMFEALATSQDPHDWALASVMQAYSPNAVDKKNSVLISHAAAALPDDAPTQWLAIQLCPAVETAALCDSAMSTLERIEPNNAAVWLQALNRAALLRDAVGVEVALERMAASTHFDDHLVGLAQRFTSAYLKFPPASEAMAAAHKMEPQTSAELLARTAASVFANAFALPAYQHLVRACAIDAELGLHVGRSADCAKVGRMLGFHGPNLVANLIGFSVLRVSHTWGDSDVQGAREVDWLMSRLQTPLLRAAMTPAISSTHYLQDWATSGSELDAVRLAVKRAGIAITPPSDWVDDQSPFAERRLAEDGRYAAEHAANPF